MVLVRLVVLLFLAFYSYGAGVGIQARTDWAGSVAVIVFYVVVAAIYLLPVYEAVHRRHPRLVPIALIDVLLGWTVIGWIAALVWAVRKPEPVAEPVENENSPYIVVEEPASRYPANSTAESLKELARLRAEGAISEEEFVAAKARVVAPR